jgi:transcriptional regulator GlxA family with amidase domain
MMGAMLRNVAVVIMNGFTPFELGVVCEVFGVDRTDDGLPRYDFAVVGGEPGPLESSTGFIVQPDAGLDRLAAADLVVVSAVGDRWLDQPAGPEYPAPMIEAVRAAVARGTRVLSVCNGAFALGAAGLLDGRHCTTHWRHAAELAKRYPEAMVNPDVLYVDEGLVITSAGTAAGIDACLHIVRKEQGTRVANGIARRMVVPPHRDGGQAQYVDQPVAVPSCDTLGEVIGWMQRHLSEPGTIRQLAERAHMSERTFARRFVQETGTTPLRWLTGQRILLAQELLEETDASIDLIADRAGFGNAATLRHHFRSWRGTTPQAYRRAFCLAEPTPDGGRAPDGDGRAPGSGRAADGRHALDHGGHAPDRSPSSALDRSPSAGDYSSSSSGRNTVGMAG